MGFIIGNIWLGRKQGNSGNIYCEAALEGLATEVF